METEVSESAPRMRVRRTDEKGDPHMLTEDGNEPTVRPRSDEGNGGGNPERVVRRRTTRENERGLKADPGQSKV